MKNEFKLIVFAGLMSIVMSCGKNDNGILNVSIDSTLKEGTEVKINTFDMVSLMPNSLAQTKVDSIGKGELKFAISTPTFGAFVVENSFYPNYLEPSYDLNVTVLNNSIKYTGIGADANNYLVKITSLISRIEGFGKKNIFELGKEDFISRIDSLEEEIKNFHNHFIDSTSLPKHIVNLFEKRNSTIILSRKQKYGRIHSMRYNTVVPQEFNMADKIPFDSTLLNIGMIEYAVALHVYMEIASLNPLVGSAEISKDASRVIQKKIRGSAYPSHLKEFMYAKNINECLIMGKPLVLDSVYSDFVKEYPKSKYLPLLKREFSKWLAISPGKLSPNFKGLTKDSTWISLKELKGKNVYVDVWATWCGPCIEEFPSAINLQKKYESNENIVFLYFSIDRNQKMWKDFLHNNPNLKGMHIVEVEGTEISIQESYIINAIPRYILINTEGIIVNSDAPRPSSKEIEIEINDLLSKE